MSTGRDGHGWLPPLPVIIAFGWIIITSAAIALARVIA